MELYLHFPFCARKCRYCDFPSWASREKDEPAYVDALLAEAAARREELGSPAVETAFLGGGTPSLMPPELLDRLLRGVQEEFPLARGAEFTVEANPGTLTEAWLRVAVSRGVNRLSMGMQALQPALLQILGRIHDFPQVEQSVRLARDRGIANINLDLMFGLPTQTRAMFRESLEAALALAPTHLSCYGLIPEEGTALKRDLDAGALTLPGEDEERGMYDDAIGLLAQAGFAQYEISNFALPGRECRHNLGYWRQTPYLGLGSSAASMLPDPTGENAYIRAANPPEIDRYVAMVRDKDGSRRTVSPIPRREAEFETMMLGLRTIRGVSEKAFAAMHGVTLAERYGDKLAAMAGEGLLVHADGRWFLTRRGLDVQNAVLVELMD